MYDNERGTSADRGYDRVWRARRIDYLTAHPWCSLCNKASSVADHYPRSRRELVETGCADPDADHLLRPLCASCHNRATTSNQPGGWNRGRVGQCTVVAGPPCSGKTTYVERHRSAKDLVVDLDALRVALGSHDTHSPDDKGRLPFALAARDAVIRRLSEAHSVPRVWVVVCAPLRWQRDLVPGASVVVLDTTQDECHRRAEGRRPPVWHQLIDDWFARYEP